MRRLWLHPIWIWVICAVALLFSWWGIRVRNDLADYQQNSDRRRQSILGLDIAARAVLDLSLWMMVHSENGPVTEDSAQTWKDAHHRYQDTFRLIRRENAVANLTMSNMSEVDTIVQSFVAIHDRITEGKLLGRGERLQLLSSTRQAVRLLNEAVDHERTLLTLQRKSAASQSHFLNQVLMVAIVMGLVLSVLLFLLQRSQRQLAATHRSPLDQTSLGRGGILSLEGFQGVLEEQWHHARVRYEPLSLIYCQIDFLKLFRERYGQLRKEELLREISTTLLTCPEESRISVACMTPDEYVLVAAGYDMELAKELAETCRVAVERHHILHETSVLGYVTLSVGVAVVEPSREVGPGLILTRAREACLEAVRQGRNCVRVASASSDYTAGSQRSL